MKEHKRAPIVRRASAELGAALMDWSRQYDLSSVEYLQCLNAQSASCLKFMLRRERHPDDPDTPADQE